MASSQRPDRTTMEGMIWNANQVLDSALDPNTNGIPRTLFEKCKGIALISVVEAGFIFSGNVGSGVVIARNSNTGKWSPPSAVGLAGVGFGFMVGAEVKDIMIMIMDEMTLDALSGEAQVKVGGQASVTLGPVGREAEVALNLSNKGAGGSFSYTFSKGIFGGISLESALIGCRSSENARFYGKNVTPRGILFEGEVEIPGGSGIDDLHTKLDMLKEGKTYELTEEDKAKKESMRVEAEKAGAAAKAEQGDSVVHVDANEEAAKE